MGGGDAGGGGDVAGVLAQKGPDVLMPFDRSAKRHAPIVPVPVILSSDYLARIVIEVLISRDDCRPGSLVLSVFSLSRFPRTRVAANT